MWEIAFATLHISKFSRGIMPADPPTASSHAARWADEHPPPLPKKFLNPYAYELA